MNAGLAAVAAAGFGLAVATVLPVVPATLRELAGLSAPPQPAPTTPTATPETPEDHAAEGRIAMTAEQAAAAGIEVATVAGGTLVDRVSVPGVLAASQDRLARVTARVAGRVGTVRKSLGDTVAEGDVLATIESREIADAKGEFLAASRTAALADTTLARETQLWKQRISAEQDALQARMAAEQARIRVDLARQRLAALGLSAADVAALPREGAAAVSRLELRAPIAGQVTARAAVQGAAVGPEAELFSIADLSTLWVELAIPPRDLPRVRQGQSVAIIGDGAVRQDARIVFVNPVLDPETRSARAVAELANATGVWQPGGFVTASLATAGQQVAAFVPRDAVQEIEGAKVVFLRTPDGFEKREVTLGRADAAGFEVTSGLEPGAEIVVGNAFALKAELGKGEAGHGH